MTKRTSETITDRDSSWLSFNGRVLEEAGRSTVPLMERIRFLSIYSSNLDEFYRVRMPALMALGKIAGTHASDRSSTLLTAIGNQIATQLNRFGQILQHEIIPSLAQSGVQLVYGQPLPAEILPALESCFFHKLLGCIRWCWLEEDTHFFPENNVLYLLFESASVSGRLCLVQLPSGEDQRLVQVKKNGIEYIVFIDDIIREFLPAALAQQVLPTAYSIKVTRDAELDLKDEFDGDLASRIEEQLQSRDLGMATRLLYDPALPEEWLIQLKKRLNLFSARTTIGGRYHHLRDLAGIRLADPIFHYPPWPSCTASIDHYSLLLQQIQQRDLLLHPPYHDYQTVLRFFNEAATHPDVTEIWITLYRVAGDSKIAEALITAARNGRRVTVFVELKARFDEANNIRWAKRMKAAGIRIIYSIPGLKVHAKIALVKYRQNWQMRYAGIFATGNFNERTARFYTDHLLFTSRPELMRELELLFHFLTHRRKPRMANEINFSHLLVAQFNLPQVFEQLIRSEMKWAAEGKEAIIRIKFNNLEDEKMIQLLYEASQAGVQIQLLVRGICRLLPGQKGTSERIQVKRIVDRYLEHGRIFYFHQNGEGKVFAGSADWMERNLHRRIEVCFPILDEQCRKNLMGYFNIQWSDNTQTDAPAAGPENRVRSQEILWEKISKNESIA